VIVTGGDGSASSLSSVEVFDPQVNEWVEKEEGLPERVQNHALVSSNDVVLNVGGAFVDLFGQKSYLNDIWQYDVTSDTWNDFGISLRDAREGHIAILTDVIDC